MSVLNFTDLRVGLEIPFLIKHITAQQLVKWAAASGDYNPIHYDSVFAASRGLSGIVVHGQMVSAYLCQMLSDWHGAFGHLKQLDVSFKGFNFLGDVLSCRGMVKEVLSSECTVLLEIWVENQHGEKTVSGYAKVQFVD